MMRIGNGYDVHALQEGLPMWMGGVRVEHSAGFVAHSDGDVLIHSLCDALLGAAALGDIGMHFPDNDPAYKGIDSKILLKKCCNLLSENGYQVVNCDIVIIAQQPKFRPYIESIRSSLSDIMGVKTEQISVKATTTEKLGFTGREEGIAVMSVVLIDGKK